MRWTNKPLQPLTAATGALAGLLCLAAALAAPAADPANPAPATLLLRNGDSLDGNLVSIDARQVLRWKHADVAEPVEFKFDRVSRLDLRPPASPERGTNYPCKVFLTQGDALEGSLVSCSRDTLCLQTWYAGPLSIPRRQVQSIYFFPTTPDVFMIAGPEGWTQGGGGGAGQCGAPSRASGSFATALFTRTNPPPSPATSNCPTRPNCSLTSPGAAILSLSIGLYTDSLQPVQLPREPDKAVDADVGAFYSMRLIRMLADVARVKNKFPVINLSPVIVPAFTQTNRVHIDLRARKKSSALALAVDGQVLQVWHDTNGFVGEGAGVRFVHNAATAPARSNSATSAWPRGTAFWRPDQTNTPPSDQDAVWLTNGTFLSGVIESLADGKMTLRGKRDKVETPIGRITRLAFASPQVEPAKELPGSVHATFARGGQLTFQLESWTAEGVSLRSPVFGQVRFDPNAFRRVVFQPLDAIGGDVNNNESRSAPAKAR